jgi:uncharacterized protein with FMN-binding domain
MQRYKLVLGGTVAGIAGVLAFPTKATHLSLPSTTPTSASGSSSTSTTPTSASGGSTSTPATAAPAARSATSSDEGFRYGDIAVTVTVKGTTITKVTVPTLNETDGRSAQIDNYAVPQLERQVIAAGSVKIDGVSGATFTSQAFVDAVADALQKLGLSA